MPFVIDQLFKEQGQQVADGQVPGDLSLLIGFRVLDHVDLLLHPAQGGRDIVVSHFKIRSSVLDCSVISFLPRPRLPSSAAYTYFS